MASRHLLLLASLATICLIQPSQASDAKSFFAYLKEVVEPGPYQNGREARQSTLTFSFNGATNFTFNVANIPTTFPIACGGDDRNYCNYPDLPLLETYDLNYYSRRPIPSGRCPDGYTKMPTFDCLNIAPALFETTCCVFMSTTPDICSSSFSIDAAFELCNRSVYITSGAYAWRLDENLKLQQGPIMLAALTGGAISRDVLEAEVDGDCNVQFFDMADRYYVVNFADGSLSSSSASSVSNLCLTGAPGIVFSTGNRGSLVYKIDGEDNYLMRSTDGFNFQCGDNTTCAIVVKPPGCLGVAPLINATAATYLAGKDMLAFFFNTGSGVSVIQSTRKGVCGALTAVNFCATTTSAPPAAPLVYIPYPIYPIFQQNKQPSYSYPSPPPSYSNPAPPPAYG